LETTVAELEAKIADLTSQLTEAGEKSESLASELASKSQELETVLADMHYMKEEDKKKKRKDKMAEAGLSDEEIEAKYETLASLSDEQFDMFITTVADMHGKKKKDEEKEKEKAMKEYAMKEKASEEAEEFEETEASELVQEETEVGNVAVSSENEEDELSTTRAALAKWVEEVVIKDK